jgi:hypothetical protein
MQKLFYIFFFASYLMMKNIIFLLDFNVSKFSEGRLGLK